MRRTVVADPGEPAGDQYSGQPALDRLVGLLDLERIEDDIFRGVSPPHTATRVFGGQVAGQALVAAGRTVPAERGVHSLHAYFIRPGDTTIPIVFQVDRIRDGRSFTTRRVTAVQRGKAIFALSASFQVQEPGLDHTVPPPQVPGPEDLPSVADLLAKLSAETGGELPAVPRPLDLRWVQEPPWLSPRTGVQDDQARTQVWMRADGVLPTDDLVHVCVLAYASDMNLLDAVLARQGLSWAQDNVLGASLDHAMWFHRPFRADDWVLYDCESPTASASRGLATGRFFTRDGRLIATTVQEGLLRISTRSG
jgi:acyl-CoA thioesterase-2